MIDQEYSDYLLVPLSTFVHNPNGQMYITFVTANRL